MLYRDYLGCTWEILSLSGMECGFGQIVSCTVELLILDERDSRLDIRTR